MSSLLSSWSLPFTDVGYSGQHEMMTKSLEMPEILANGYSSERSTQQEISYEYPHDLVYMIFIIFCILVHWTKVPSASDGLHQRPMINDQHAHC